MTPERARVGLIGCGNVANLYLEGCPKFPVLELAACADPDAERAARVAAKGGLRAMTVEDLLADPSIEIVLNLTPPLAHAEVSRAAIAAGKHVYSEKPLATDRASAEAVLADARTAGVRLGCAPDTFLGGALQTARSVVDAGGLGEPLGFAATFMNSGPEVFHPNPDLFYAPGGGPVLDLGPYYLTALVNLLGPVATVSAAARSSFPVRRIRVGPRAGESVAVSVPTYVIGVLTFASGAIGSFTMTFDTGGSSAPNIELYGSEAILRLADPNGFDAPIHLRAHEGGGWAEVPAAWSWGALRGIGLADMATAIRSGRPHRASGEQAYHVLDVLLGLEEAASAGRTIAIDSTYLRPAALPADALDGRLDP
jgi:predicted dehydrogenase